MFLTVRLAIVIVEPSAIDRQLGNDRSRKIGASAEEQKSRIQKSFECQAFKYF